MAALNPDIQSLIDGSLKRNAAATEANRLLLLNHHCAEK